MWGVQDIRVNNSQAGSCKPCIHSSDCPAGYFAAECGGYETVNPPCVRCPVLPFNSHTMYVPYAGQTGMNSWGVSSGKCPSACMNNYHISDAGVCVSCASSTPIYDGNQLQFIYSYWDAAPAVPWYAPPYILCPFLSCAFPSF